MYVSRFAFLFLFAIVFFASVGFAIEDREDSEDGSTHTSHDPGSGITGNPGGGSASNGGSARAGTGVGMDDAVGGHNHIGLIKGPIINGPILDLRKRRMHRDN